MANRRAQTVARRITRNGLDGCSQHVNSIWSVRLRLFVTFLGDMVNENILESEGKYNIVYVQSVLREVVGTKHLSSPSTV